ncbi:hypothetical protein LG200_05115 [Methylobacillus caricis]|uniref:hypothetical protein n=1 Tax=Methylobacillus caricis TaxID=1971611 RepID=UPI001CFF8D51|nr:hypothetical protein [Methylobacillus caricis]MCB5187384.1 hypothetical protein [Methylobacillus caricis]
MIPLRITSLLMKNEATYGVDAAPTAALNAVLLSGQPTFTPMEIRGADRDLIRPYFGNFEQLIGSITGQINFSVEGAGSGTAGVAPAYGPALRACGLSESLLAAAIIGTAQGGTADTVQLAAAASAVNNFYNGRPITITDGTGEGQAGVIVDYDGATKTAKVIGKDWIETDNTSQYSIEPSVVYTPISANHESITIYLYIKDVLHRFVGTRGNAVFELGANAIPKWNFAFQGVAAPVEDNVIPNPVFSAWKKPLLANKNNTPLVAFLGAYDIGLESISLDLGNEIQFLDFINITESFEQTDRRSQTNISLEAVNVAVSDLWGAVRDGTTGNFAVGHGLQAGNRVTVCSNSVVLNNPNYGEKTSVRTFTAEMRHLPIDGNDELYITIH